jgi:hypothetical protein
MTPVATAAQITDDDGIVGAAEEVRTFDEPTERTADLGLSIAESKSLLAAFQHKTFATKVAAWSVADAAGALRRTSLIANTNPRATAPYDCCSSAGIRSFMLRGVVVGESIIVNVLEVVPLRSSCSQYRLDLRRP